jgi:hypothetical protein
MADDTASVVFYVILLLVFTLSVIIVLWWFLRSTGKSRIISTSSDQKVPLSPRTVNALNGLCSKMRSANAALDSE